MRTTPKSRRRNGHVAREAAGGRRNRPRCAAVVASEAERGEKRPTQRCSPSITRVAVDPHSQRFSARRHLVVPAPRDLPRCDVYLANGPRLIEAA
ncbi:unnamed protein product [Ixodes pacificus]